MVLIIYVPVLFVCMNNTCNFLQSSKYHTREADCKASLIAQQTKLETMAAQAGHTITLLQGACITAREGML